MFSNAQAVAIMKHPRPHSFQLLSVDKSTIRAAFVMNHIVAILVMDGRVTTRSQLILRKQDIAASQAANRHLWLLQDIFLHNLAVLGAQDQATGILYPVDGRSRRALRPLRLLVI